MTPFSHFQDKWAKSGGRRGGGLPVCSTVLLAHFWDGFIAVAPSIHLLEVCQLHPLAVQALSHFLEFRLASSQLELRVLVLLLQFFVLPIVSLQDVVKFFNLHALEGTENLFEFLHVVLVPTQSYLHFCLVLNTFQGSCLHLAGVLDSLLQLFYLLLKALPLAHQS